MGEENQKNRAQSASRRRGAPSAWVGRPSLCCACCGAERAGGTGGGDARRLPPEEARWGGWGGKEPAARRPQRPQRTRERASRGGRRRETRASAPAQPVPPRNTSATPAPSVPPPRSPSSAPRARGARCAACTGPGAQAQAPAAPPLLSCGLADARARGRRAGPKKNMRRQTARAGEVKSNRIRAKQNAGSVRFARGRSGYFRPRRRRGAPREGA